MDSRERPVFIIDGPGMPGLSPDELNALRGALRDAVASTTPTNAVRVSQASDILPPNDMSGKMIQILSRIPNV